MNSPNLVLSVCVRSYNQRDFIGEALDSVLCQCTTFPFEIIVSDDFSTDGTKEILIEYQKRFPQRIRLILGDVNIGGPKNLRRVIEASSAKYITCLDGDDYYTDEFKLEKQVHFLENHPEFTGCFHNTINVDERGKPFSLFNPIDFPSIHDAKMFIQEKWFIPIHSAMIRRELIAFPQWYESVVNDDYVVHLSVVKYGPYYYRPDIMVAYRHHTNNVSQVYEDPVLTASKLRDILEGFYDIYPKELLPVLKGQIDNYNEEITYWESEQRKPWKKYLRLKTYSKFTKRLLTKVIN